MTKETLKQISALHRELQDLKSRLTKLDQKPSRVVTDSVKASSTSYPYIQHSCVIEGLEDSRSKRKYRKIIKSKEVQLGKLITKLEYDLNYIEDSELRQIIRYKYEDNLTWIQIMYKMEYKSEETARIKLKRFLEKI